MCGELETKLKEGTKEGIVSPFFIFRKRFFLLLLVILFGISIADEIWIYRISIPNEEAKIRWVDNLAFLGTDTLYALIIPVFAGFGFLLYWLWDDSHHRYGASFKGSFLEIVPSIEKLSEIAMLSVIFLSSAVFLNDLAWRNLEQIKGLGQVYSKTAEIFHLYHTLMVGTIIIMPLVLYFLYLGKLTTNLKAIELGKIDAKLKMLSIHTFRSRKKKEYIEREKEALLSDRDRVSKSLRWIVGVEYGSRMLLLLFLGLGTYLIGQTFV